MCGRYVIKTLPQAIAEAFEPLFGPMPDMPPRYNVAPSQPVPVVLQTPQGRRLEMLQWGLIPFWATDPAAGARPINARSETIRQKPTFRKPFERQRCIFIADGFYEWQKTAEKSKQPFYIHPRDEKVMGFAGIWDRWTKGAEPIESAAILTTSANELMKPIHDRMPVILRGQDYDRWLDPATEIESLLPLLKPAAESELTAYAISTLVNNPRNDRAECLAEA